MYSRTLAKSITALDQNRQALISAWESAIQSACGPVVEKEAQNAALHVLLDEILEGLRAAAPQQAGFNIGRRLAAISCKRPELFGQITLLLNAYLQPPLSPAGQFSLPLALASLVGGMAQGYHDETAARAQSLHSLPLTVQHAEDVNDITILDVIDALIVVVDVEGRIVGFNGAAERVSGYASEDVVGRHYTFLQTPESQAKTDALLERFKALRSVQDSFVAHRSIWVTRQGERRDIEWSMTALFDEEGIIRYVIGTGADVTGSRQMERELAEAHRQVAMAKEAERLRLAQDLHDDAVQQLLGISYQLAEMQRRAAEDNVWSPAQRLEELVPGLEVIRGEIITVAQGLRRLISSLRPPALREMGLAEILEAYVSEWRMGVGQVGPRVKLEIEEIEGQYLPEPVANCIFRLVQEGLWNAQKHAEAAQVTVTVRYADDTIVLRIKDDGSGFDIPKHLFQFAAAGRFGFIGMQERVHAVDGLLSVWSIPDQGTEIQACIPLSS